MTISYESAVNAVITKAVEIGSTLPDSARPFYVAYCYQLQVLGPDVWPRIGTDIGVNELTDESILFAEWGDATARDDHARCQAIEERLAAAGHSDSCFQALDASERLARAMPALLRGLPANDSLH